MLSLIFFGVFAWAMVVGFKTLYRRLTGALGTALSGDWSVAEERRLSASADSYRPVTVDRLTSEMESALARERAGAADLIAQSSERHVLLGDAQRAIDSWDEKSRAAIDKGRDDLARAALVERGRAAVRADGLRDEIARIDDLLGGYQLDIRTLQARLGDVYRRRSIAAARIDRAEAGVVTRNLLGDDWTEAQPDFDRLDRAADLAEARLEALSLGAPSSFGRRIAAPAGAPASLAPLAAPLDPRVELELAALKARLGPTSAAKAANSS